MKVAIVGSGYVGLVTGTCFAEVGIEVMCVDVDTRKIASIRKGRSYIGDISNKELSSVVQNGSFSATADSSSAETRSYSTL